MFFVGAKKSVAVLRPANLTYGMKTLLTILVAAAVGAIAWQQSQISRLRAENEKLRAETQEVAVLKQEVKQLRPIKVQQDELDRLKSVQKEVVQLRGRVSEGIQAKKELAQLNSDVQSGKIGTSAPGSADAPTNGFMAMMSGAMKQAVEQQSAARLSRMKAKLNLTPDQEERIKEILARQSEQGLQMAQKMFGAKNGAPADQPTPQNSGNPEKEIQDLLTPEQKTAYKEYKKEESSAKARVIANSELLQMQNTVGLSQEQQDKVFPILYEATLKQTDPDRQNPVMKSGDPAAIIQSAFDDKLKAMEGVLTPEQLENYRKAQEAQLKLIKGMLPNFPKPPPPLEVPKPVK
jgi:hypothetical protein